MQRWEYLEVFLAYSDSRWRDSSGREGGLVRSDVAGEFVHAAPLQSELG